MRPVASNSSERELVVPASSARMNFFADPGAALTISPSGRESARLQARGPVDGVDGAHVADRVVATGEWRRAPFDDLDDVTKLEMERGVSAGDDDRHRDVRGLDGQRG